MAQPIEYKTDWRFRCFIPLPCAAWVNVAGTLLGVPKAMSALLSGEMRDTVELNSAGVYLLEKYFSRNERAKLFRSWAGAVRPDARARKGPS